MMEAGIGKTDQNWIDLIQRIYSLEGDDCSWLDGILAGINRHGLGEGIAAYSFTSGSLGVSVKDVAVCGGPAMYEKIQELVRASSPEALHLTFGTGRVVGTLSEYIWRNDPTHADTFNRITNGPPDVLGIVAHSGDGEGVVLNLPLLCQRKSTTTERRQWMRGAAHIGAALRLRRQIEQLVDFDSSQIEAVFDGKGKLHDARKEAASTTSLQVLRKAVKQIDKARSSGGCNDSEGFLLEWEALVRGRWSLIDKFDTDNRRFVVAVRNDPDVSDPRGLSKQERQVAEYVGLGRLSKEISYILGIPPASVDNSVRRAVIKLGLMSRVELAWFFAPRGVRARLAEIALDKGSLLIGSSPMLNTSRLAGLTESEKGVLGLIIAGSSNADIAARRATSVRTVANQVQAIFRKCGARSRGELIMRVSE